MSDIITYKDQLVVGINVEVFLREYSLGIHGKTLEELYPLMHPTHAALIDTLMDKKPPGASIFWGMDTPEMVDIPITFILQQTSDQVSIYTSRTGKITVYLGVDIDDPIKLAEVLIGIIGEVENKHFPKQ